MPTPPDHLSEDDFQTLTRLAGLTISADREPLVLAEYAAQLANLALIETVLPAPNPAARIPFNPTFPAVTTAEPTR